MAEDLTLTGLDAPRPLPPALRARLESALLAAATPAGALVPDVRDPAELPAPEDPLALDAPRSLPDEMRTRLEGAVLTAARARPAASGWWAAWSRPLVAMAAVLALLLGSVALLNRGGSEGDLSAAGPQATTPPSTISPSAGPEVVIPSTTTGPPAALPPISRPAPQGRKPVPPTTVPSAPPGESRLVAPPGGGAPEPAPTPPGTGTGPEAQDPGPPPPFASPSSPAASSDQAPAAATAPAAPGSQGGASPTPAPRSAAPPASGPALRVGVIGGDAAQEAGFNAYLALLNREGGVRGRPLQAVPVGPGAVDSSTIVTVNLSPRPVATPGGAPGWAGGAVLETLTATEDLLPAGGRVFSFASVPERQAHLAVDAVFPDASPGASAVIYAATDGPYAGKVADAFRTVLTAKGVTVTTVVYDPDRPPTLLPASGDAAFVSLDPPAAAAFARHAREANYRPVRGIAGVASLFDPAVAGDLPDGARVVSPYLVPGGAEGDAIRSGAGEPSAGVLHGWATAKVLAVALWRTGADSPDETVSALEGMAGYDSGLAPPYETRPQTRSRTPEGVVFEVHSGVFAAQGTFRRDPY